MFNTDPKYNLNDSVELSQLHPNLTQNKLDTTSVELATYLDLVSEEVIKDKDLLDALAYPKNIVSHTDSDLCLMRLGYIVDKEGELNLIEVNSQTPSFWQECEDNQPTKEILAKCITQQIQLHTKKLGKLMQPNIGLVTCDNADDIVQMSFLEEIIKKEKLAFWSEVITINRLDVSTTDRVFSLNTDKEFDILFFWYPLEWLAEDQFADGTKAGDRIISLLKQNKLGFINGIQSFVVQNKNFLGYLTELSKEEKQPQSLVPSYYTLEEFNQKQKNKNWIGKPIFGREGCGIFGKLKDIDITGNTEDDYYNNQWYIYQPFLESSTLSYKGINYNYTLEKWVYKINNNWIAGGQALRINEGLITDVKSAWLGLKQS